MGLKGAATSVAVWRACGRRSPHLGDADRVGGGRACCCMDPPVARSIAHYSNGNGRNRFDEPLIEHVERVAAAVPPEARSVAYLHDVLEHSSTSVEDLFAEGLDEQELEALTLLTRRDPMTFEEHALQIAWARGSAGDVARSVKLADLDDHLDHRSFPDDA